MLMSYVISLEHFKAKVRGESRGGSTLTLQSKVNKDNITYFLLKHNISSRIVD